jgi:hypothetical protein
MFLLLAGLDGMCYPAFLLWSKWNCDDGGDEEAKNIS